MKPRVARLSFHLTPLAAVIALSIVPYAAFAQQAPPAAQPAVQQTATTESDAPTIPPDQMDSLVAPIALFPDALLAQTLAASTYPLEIIQLQQWLEKNKGLKDKALADAVAKQPWDPSVQSLAGVPELVPRLAGNVQWTTELGNAFLAQQDDLLAAVQRMRAKAQDKGALKTSEQQTVQTETAGGKEVIVIEQPNEEVVYVPSYDPAAVYGEPAYPYYQYSYPGYIAGAGLAFGAGIVAGEVWGDNWGDCDWDNGDININNENNFNKNNVNRGDGSGNWEHRPEHRGTLPTPIAAPLRSSVAAARPKVREELAEPVGLALRAQPLASVPPVLWQPGVVPVVPVGSVTPTVPAARAVLVGSVTPIAPVARAVPANQEAAARQRKPKAAVRQRRPRAAGTTSVVARSPSLPLPNRAARLVAEDTTKVLPRPVTIAVPAA